MDVVPRPRFSKLRLAAFLAVCACILAAGLHRRVPQAYYQGRSTGSWIGEVVGAEGRQLEAIAAFNAMGTNAEPFLMNAMLANPDPLSRAYRVLYERLPSVAQGWLSKPEDPALSRMAAVILIQHATNTALIADVYPLLARPDSALRQSVLDALKNSRPSTNQLPYLVMAGADEDPFVGAEAWRRLAQMGPAAASAAPQVKALCDTSTNLEIRHDAAWVLWRMTSHTNTSLPVLEQVLFAARDSAQAHVVAHDLLMMNDTNAAFVSCLIHSLTNGDAADRAIVCSYLGQIGPAASAAIPALREALQDKAPEVRRRADVALSAIEK